MMVVAASEDEARQVADDHLEEETNFSHHNEFWVRPARGIASGWGDDSVPYGNSEDEAEKTVREWLTPDGVDDGDSRDDDDDQDEDDDDRQDEDSLSSLDSAGTRYAWTNSDTATDADTNEDPDAVDM